MKAKQEKINELTTSGDLTTTFQIHEELNRQSKLATNIALQIIHSKECVAILMNTLESKMKAAGEIAEYEQAQIYKRTREVGMSFGI